VIQGNEIVAAGIKQSNEIFMLFFQTTIPVCTNEANVSVTSLKVWHERLGHLNKRALKELVSKDVVSGIKLSEKGDFFCDARQLSKSHKLPFKKTVGKLSPVSLFTARADIGRLDRRCKIFRIV